MSKLRMLATKLHDDVVEIPDGVMNSLIKYGWG